jgi:hypothetical protein
MTKQNRPSLEDYLDGSGFRSEIKSQFEFDLISTDFSQLLDRCSFLKAGEFTYSQKNQTFSIGFYETPTPSDRKRIYVELEYRSKIRQIDDSLNLMSDGCQPIISGDPRIDDKEIQQVINDLNKGLI